MNRWRRGEVFGAADRLVGRLSGMHQPAPSPWSPARVARVLEGLSQLQAAVAASPLPHFPAAAAPEARLKRRRTARSRWLELTWPSRHRCLAPPLWGRSPSLPLDDTARALVEEPDAAEDRPALLLVHGYRGGQPHLCDHAWPLTRLRRMGFSLAVGQLPFHGLRARSLFARPPFPGNNPQLNVEALRQSCIDLGDLVAWLRQRGHPTVGVVGFSLGAHVAALLATVDPALDCLLALAPPESLARFAFDHGQLGRGTDSVRLAEALEGLYAPFEPLGRRPRVPATRSLVVVGSDDALTPRAGAQRVARHFGAEYLERPGSHVVQHWSTSAWDWLERIASDRWGDQQGRQ